MAVTQADINSGNKPQVGKPISQLKSVEDLIKKVDALERWRLPLVRQWRLNYAFYKGKQYVFYPAKSDRLESLAVEDGMKPRHRVRLVSNQIMPGVHTLLAQLTKTKPRMYATPGGGGEQEVRAAEMAESLLEYWWQDLALDEKLDEALLWSLICSAGYWQIYWNPYAAKQMRFVLGPNGQPIVDDTLKTEFVGQLEKMGIQPKEKVVYMGDICVEVISPFNVLLDPGSGTFEDAKYAIVVQDLDPDEIRTRWGKTVTPNVAPATPDSSLPFANSVGAYELSLRRVYTGYFKPTAAMPNGRVVVWVDGGDKQILADYKWPYPSNDLPLVKFAGMRVPGAIYDDAVVTHAIPLQKELNRTISQIVEYKNLTIAPVMIAPVGSLRTRRTTEPGQVIEYAPTAAGLKPEFDQPQAMPPYVFEHLSDISARLKEIFLSAEVLQGNVPPNVEAGIAIDLLQEMAVDKLAPIIKLIEMSLARAGQQMLSLAQKYYVEPRLLKIQGSGGSTQVKQFVNADINGNITVHVETGSGLPRTRAGRQARIERLIELGLIEPRRALRYLELADLGDVEKLMQANEAKAYRTIDAILQGETVNPVAVYELQQQMQAQAAQGQPVTDPESGQPFESPDQVAQALHKAGLQPPPGIDFDTHLDIIGTYMMSVEFPTLPIPTQQDFQTYWYAILQAKFNLMPLPEAAPSKVSLNIRSTAGPTATSKILERSGIAVTPDDLTEPPIESTVETMVRDNVDDEDLAQAIVSGTKLHESEQQLQANEAATQQQAASHAHGMAQSQEMHLLKLQEQAAKTHLAVRKARETQINKPQQPKRKAA